MKTHTYLPEDELVRRAVEVLIEALRHVEATRFLAMTHGKRLDSVLRHHRWQDTLDKDAFFEQVWAKDAPADVRD